MKAKIFILSLLSVCTAICTVSLSACDETESSSSSPSASSSSSSSSSSSEETEEAVSTTVSIAEWSSALSPTAFSNFTATGTTTETTTESTTTSSFVASFAADKLKTTYTEDGFSYTVYTAIESSSVYMYMDFLGNGTYTKSDMGIDASLFPSAAYLSPAAEIFHFASLYSSFSYEKTTGAYTALRIDVDPTTYFENVVLKFENGVLVSYSASCTTTEIDGTVTEASSITFSGYGTTSVTLPVIESEPSVKGDGIITASEWASAFSAGALANVKMSYTLTFDGGVADTMHIYFDDSNVVKINAKFSGYDDDNIPYTILTDQYWIENYEYVYVSGIIGDEVIGWTPVPANNQYEAAQNCRKSLYTFTNFYQAFTFDGYEGTFDSGDGTMITVRFNEQEQLIYFSDGDTMTISLSNYGTIDNELPVGATT